MTKEEFLKELSTLIEKYEDSCISRQRSPLFTLVGCHITITHVIYTSGEKHEKLEYFEFDGEKMVESAPVWLVGCCSV